MNVFTSSKEKRYWWYVLITALAILSSLIFGKPLQKLFQNQDVQAVIFLLGMVLMAVTILIYGLRSKANASQLVVWIGLAAIYLMLFLRLGISERSHMIEYSVLAILTLQAFQERFSTSQQTFLPVLYAIIFPILIGVLDECIQLFIPDRVFDPLDIYFNSMMVVMAIVSLQILKYLKSIFRKK